MHPSAAADGVFSAHRIGGPAGYRQSTIRSAELVVDLETRVVWSGDKPVPLTGKEYCIFELLSLRRGTVVTKQMLLDHLYGGLDEPELKIIDVFVCHLPKKLAQATGGKHCIETIWGRGYRVRDPGRVPALPNPCETEDIPDRSSAGSRISREERSGV